MIKKRTIFLNPTRLCKKSTFCFTLFYTRHEQTFLERAKLENLNASAVHINFFEENLQSGYCRCSAIIAKSHNRCKVFGEQD